MIKRSMVRLLEKFIINRHNAYLAREAGKPKPWTKDPIIQQYRFCNMYRELDTVTKWIATNWRDPNTNDPDVWFAMLVARYVNLPRSMEMIGYPVPWDKAAKTRWLQAVASCQEDRRPFFNAAYIIPTGGTKNTGPKHESLSNMFDHMWGLRKDFRPEYWQNRPLRGVLENLAKRLVAQPAIGTFMAGQVIADLKYTEPYVDCDDWWTFAVSGPGSRRGLNRVCGQPVDQRWSEELWHDELTDLRIMINATLRNAELPELHAQDMQNCLCEFDKWCRAYYKEGTPKQVFAGV